MRRLTTRRIQAIVISTLLLFGFNNCSPTQWTNTSTLEPVSEKELASFKNDAGETVEYVKSRVLIVPKKGVSEDRLDDLVRKKRGKQRHRVHPKLNVEVVELEKGTDALNALLDLASDPDVESAELDIAHPHEAVFNDPYANAWHLSKTKATTAWDQARGAGVTIAILDSGVNPIADLSLVAGYNAYNNNTDTTDVYGHGTKVASAAAAIGNNGIGVVGMAPSAKIMPIRVTDTAGYGYTSAMVAGLSWAADRGARVANISFRNICASSAVWNAANYFKSKGGLVTVSAGNTGTNDQTTTNSSSVICVSATTSSDAKASWSDYGKRIDLAAPGASIYVASRTGTYGAASGTSFAAPVTAGLIALVISAKPSLTANEIESIIKANADDLGTAGRDDIYGNGRINAARAVAAVLGSAPAPSPTPSPAPATEIIIDNTSSNTSKSGNSWSISSSSGYYATGSLYSNSGSLFRWLPNLSQTKTYQVYAWWTYHANRSTSVPYRIKSSTGAITTVPVNQRDSSKAGKWILLGTYQLGVGSYVEVSSENGQANADAVRLVPQ